MPLRLVKLQISNFCSRFPFKHPDAIKQIEPSSKTASVAPYQVLAVSHITWEGCCLHKQKKLTPSLLGFTSNFAGDCIRTEISQIRIIESRNIYLLLEDRLRRVMPSFRDQEETVRSTCNNIIINQHSVIDSKKFQISALIVYLHRNHEGGATRMQATY